MRYSVQVAASLALAVLAACGVTLTAGSEPAQAAFPGTNGKIVFVEQDEQEGDDGIKLVNPNGSELTTLVEPHGHALFRDPAFSPDGTRVAYARDRTGPNRNTSEIYKINIANRQITPITDNAWYDGDPTWKPDGTRIAFVRGESVRGAIKNTDIFVRRSDGTGKTVNLTNTPDEDEFGPAWSPDGEEIAFYSTDTEDIHVLNLETDQVRNLTDDGTAQSDYNPNWSPDGSRIVFQSSTDKGYERIYTMDASDGSDRRLLAQTWYDSVDRGPYFENPTYSPDGKQIAYVKTFVDYVYTRPRLYKMNSSTGANKQLVYDAYNPGPGRYPYGEGVFLLSPDWGVKDQR